MERLKCSRTKEQSLLFPCALQPSNQFSYLPQSNNILTLSSELQIMDSSVSDIKLQNVELAPSRYETITSLGEFIVIKKMNF